VTPSVLFCVSYATGALWTWSLLTRMLRRRTWAGQRAWSAPLAAFTSLPFALVWPVVLSAVLLGIVVERVEGK
jgi:hypothetical protein